ncbi:hypothetical protein AB205_0204330 [Aquarana catesbeiana]|uniref:Mediator of RNA polymerase II transcription subunit 8 n=1 Tax=Aquarana catesbeiana TaxID=8400 RepID=A0A2G9RE47_AQUCT|nr:hypothetical protein AB205_0204330 [Aquarana catesbeiana]
MLRTLSLVQELGAGTLHRYTLITLSAKLPECRVSVLEDNKPSVLDNFALLSGQLSTLNKVLKNEKMPLLKNQVIIPLLLTPDRDEEIMRLTEGRVPVFSHEVVPDHLRTKPDPEVEDLEKQLTTDAARITPETAQKQVQTMNKLCTNLLEKIIKEERESDVAKLVKHCSSDQQFTGAMQQNIYLNESCHARRV